MKALIVEDERLTAQRLERLLQAFDGLEVIGSIMSVQAAREWFAHHQHPDLLFLDIQLGDGTAFELLESVQPDSHIIFTTAYDEYALRAFKYNSVDYLLKPVEEEELASALHKYFKHNAHSTEQVQEVIQDLQSHFSTRYRKRFLVKAGQGYQKVNMTEIAYFYNQEGVTFARLIEGRSIPLDMTLERLTEGLDPEHFLRINRQLVVSVESILRIEPYLNGRLLLQLSPAHTDEVIVSRERVSLFKAWMNS